MNSRCTHAAEPESHSQASRPFFLKSSEKGLEPGTFFAPRPVFASPVVQARTVDPAEQEQAILPRQAEVAPASGGASFPPTVFHPGVEHNHQPTGRWAEVKKAARLFGSTSEFGCSVAAGPREVLMLAYLHELSDLGRIHLMHYINGGGVDLPVDLADVIRRDVGVRGKLAFAIRNSQRDSVTIDQGDYDVNDFRGAFGAIDRMDYEVDSSAGLVHVWFKDRYEFHPVGFGYSHYPDDIERETNCVHAAAVELKASGAADYWMLGDAVVPLELFQGKFSYSWGTSERKEGAGEGGL